MITAPPKLANIWFGDNERSTATTIGSLATPLGGIAGFVFPVFFITNYPTDEEGNVDWEVPGRR